MKFSDAFEEYVAAWQALEAYLACKEPAVSTEHELQLRYAAAKEALDSFFPN